MLTRIHVSYSKYVFFFTHEVLSYRVGRSRYVFNTYYHIDLEDLGLFFNTEGPNAYG